MEFTRENFESGLQKLCKFVAKFNPTLDCIEFRDITRYLTPLEFRGTLEKLTKSRFTEAEVSGAEQRTADYGVT